MQFSEKLLSSYFLSKKKHFHFFQFNLLNVPKTSLLMEEKQNFLNTPSLVLIKKNSFFLLSFLYCWPEPYINIFIFGLFQRLWKRRKKNCYEEIIKALCEFMVIKLISVKMRISLDGVDVYEISFFLLIGGFYDEIKIRRSSWRIFKDL